MLQHPNRLIFAVYCLVTLQITSVKMSESAQFWIPQKSSYFMDQLGLIAQLIELVEWFSHLRIWHLRTRIVDIRR